MGSFLLPTEAYVMGIDFLGWPVLALEISRIDPKLAARIGAKPNWVGITPQPVTIWRSNSDGTLWLG